MKALWVFLVLVFIVVFSCKKNNTDNANQLNDTLAVNANRISNTISETLTPNAKKALKDWPEYNDVDLFIIDFYNISVSEALAKSEALEGLVKLMKDSIRIEELKQPNLKARINVLHNETLRLDDMATISSISDDEVERQVNKIILVYKSVTAKINTIYLAQEFDLTFMSDTLEVSEIKKTPNEIDPNTFNLKRKPLNTKPAKEKEKMIMDQERFKQFQQKAKEKTKNQEKTKKQL